ncbi:MAG: hypothetical protein KIH63_000790 [Candidatus Saccharibacteria bacterium]|nr:hypothetical protein [Candidatus Saccharibacteria bacterium]
MRKRLSLIICSISVLATFAAVPVVVAETTTEQSTDTTTATQKEALRERLEKKKAELSIKLGEAEKQRITSRCSSAQGKVKSLSENVSGRGTVRQQAYAKLVEKLEALVPKLQAKGVDTATLETQISSLKEKIAKFDADLSLYRDSITDLKEVDCTTDPEAFQAALQAARTLRDALVDDALDIRTYVNNTIKETIKSIRQQLSAQESTTSEPTTAPNATNQTEGTN